MGGILRLGHQLGEIDSRNKPFSELVRGIGSWNLPIIPQYADSTCQVDASVGEMLDRVSLSSFSRTNANACVKVLREISK